jgi:hypothetical protein
LETGETIDNQRKAFTIVLVVLEQPQKIDARLATAGGAH